MDSSGTADWTEVGAGVFSKRYEPCDVTTTAIVGADGVMVVDTRCSLVEARELKEDLRRVTGLPIRWVVNTHAHFDHVWGNAEFDVPRLVPPAEFWAHQNTASLFDLADPEVVEFLATLSSESPEWAAKVAELELRAPDRLVSGEHTLDLGERVVELRHLGRGHTDADLLLWVPDARVLVAGDVIEESGPPSYALDSFPLDWPATLDAVLSLAASNATFVPGHGDPVGEDFVREQRGYVQKVADQITELHRNGVSAADAIAAGSWPHERSEIFSHAIERGYAQLAGEIS
jgi:glyoxylase-like metal-dependent hydrolase (beta-lactamase superfamily II)